jgi:hypothetical protein
MTVTRRLAAILAADIASYSRLMGRRLTRRWRETDSNRWSLAERKKSVER